MIARRSSLFLIVFAGSLLIAQTPAFRTMEANDTVILRLVLGEGLRHATIGLLLGLSAAFAITRAIKAWLFGVSPIDPITMAAAAALLLLVATAACFFPAFNATRVDPIVALHCE